MRWRRKRRTAVAAAGAGARTRRWRRRRSRRWRKRRRERRTRTQSSERRRRVLLNTTGIPTNASVKHPNMSRIRLAKQEKENTCEQQLKFVAFPVYSNSPLCNYCSAFSPPPFLSLLCLPLPLNASPSPPFLATSPLRLLQFSTLPSWFRVCETASGAFRHSSSLPRLSPEETNGIACVDVGCLCDRWEFEDGLPYFCHCVCNKRKY